MLTIILLVIIIAAISIVIQSALLLGISKLFKIVDASYKKSIFIILWSGLAQVGVVILFSLIGLAPLAPVLALIVAVIVFCRSLKHYYQVSWGKSIGIYFTSLVVGGIIAIFVVVPVRLFLIEPFVVAGSSMSPHLNQNDYLIIEKFDTNFKRDDVIVFKNSNSSAYLIKRIIGLPTEHVAINNEVLSINGTQLNDQNLVGQFATSTTDITLGTDEYFVIGDNLSKPQLDSRIFGAVKASSIVGRVAVNFGKM